MNELTIVNNDEIKTLLNQVLDEVQELRKTLATKNDNAVKYYTVKQFAKLTSSSESGIYAKIYDNTIKTKRIGKKILIPSSEL